MQARNETCGCHSGKKYMNCCGRFSLAEMTSTLSEFVASNKRKDRLIQRGLAMMSKCEASFRDAYLCLVNPKPNDEGSIEWTIVGRNIPVDEREAVVTRRVLAGYLPFGCVVSGGQLLMDDTLLPEEYRQEYVAFAIREMFLIAKTLDGKAEPEDSHLFPVAWSDRSYPGQLVKPRKPGTFKVEVDIENRFIRLISPLNAYLDMPFDEDFIEGEDVEEDALDTAQHLIAALSQVPPPNGSMTGDIVEAYLMRAEGSPKLLARVPAEATAPNVMTGVFGMGGAA